MNNYSKSHQNQQSSYIQDGITRQCDSRVFIHRIIHPDDPRVHSALLRYTWARFWYYCRAYDFQGQGIVHLSWDKTKADLSCHYSTIYGWLKEMKRVGAIRDYRRDGDCLTLWLGSLMNVARNLNLDHWGTVTTAPLSTILGTGCKSLDSRATATAIATQQLQEQSRYAARRCNKNKRTRIPTAEEVINARSKTSSRCSGQGPMPVARVLHVSKQRVFVSAGFTPFGVSQRRIASELGISEKTARRHFAQMDVESRQLCQAKAAYKEITQAMEWESDYWSTGGITLNRSKLVEPHTKRPQKVSRERFFSYMGKTWISRTNLYALQYDVIPMARARRIYRSLISRKRRNRPTIDKKNLINSRGDSGVGGISKADLKGTLKGESLVSSEISLPSERKNPLPRKDGIGSTCVSGSLALSLEANGGPADRQPPE